VVRLQECLVLQKKNKKKKNYAPKHLKTRMCESNFFEINSEVFYEIIPNNFEKTEHLKDWYYQVFHWLFEITKEFE
jgi:hypothetical protein